MSTGKPIVLTIPWKFCAQANHRLLPVLRRTKTGKVTVRLITAAGYREAKAGAEYTIKAQWKGAEMLKGRLSLTARCFFPDRRKRDASNLGKLLADACSGIVYADDSQIEDERWIKAGTDKANPRVEISVTPIAEEAA